ncbi:MAG: hypothetical protein HY096_10660 [Nitrospinae bacterium]|nr:hypothetical protein [Nitrospinota bacterium]
MKTIFLCFIGILIAPIYFATAAKPDYRVFLTADTEGNVPKDGPADNFDCRHRIYIVFEGTELKKGRYILEGFWINPKGKQQEYTRYEFEASKGKKQVWLWLELDPGGGKIFRAITPSYGTEYFSGRWKVKLYLDGNFLTEKFFHVIC